MGPNQFISYLRVSTSEQGESGLGLEAQRQAVRDYLRTVSAELVEEYVEVESGSRKDRQQLALALESCKRRKATLIIAKLDRLARNVVFISSLVEAGVSFVAVDNPHANKLMIHLLAAFAEHERDQISSRTKAALAAAKARGVVLGTYGKEVLSKRNREAAIERARQLAPIISELRKEAPTIEKLTAAMNERGIPTPRGGRWHAPTVEAVLRRIRRLG
jgi:DNA invertase Pin-like site-specific DNA recombinase